MRAFACSQLTSTGESSLTGVFFRRPSLSQEVLPSLSCQAIGGQLFIKPISRWGGKSVYRCWTVRITMPKSSQFSAGTELTIEKYKSNLHAVHPNNYSSNPSDHLLFQQNSTFATHFSASSLVWRWGTRKTWEAGKKEDGNRVSWESLTLVK